MPESMKIDLKGYIAKSDAKSPASNRHRTLGRGATTRFDLDAIVEYTGDAGDMVVFKDLIADAKECFAGTTTAIALGRSLMDFGENVGKIPCKRMPPNYPEPVTVYTGLKRKRGV